MTNRAEVRRLRRSRKTHTRRLRRLAQSLQGIPDIEAVLSFCRRRGYSHEEKDADEDNRSYQFHRSTFFEALRRAVVQFISPEHQERVRAACSRHLNESCHREAELRPARFDNRGPTRCHWDGCDHHVPKSENDYAGRLRQPLFAWLLPVFGESREQERLRRSVEHWVGELAGLAAAYHGTQDAAARKVLDKRAKKVFANLLARVGQESSPGTAEKFRQDWKEYYRKAVAEILRGSQGGRVRFCRRHSVEYVDCLLANKTVPSRQDISEADLVSRKQQIVFRRLWRLVEARLLPLAGGRIDRVVVERVAFDILAGPFKDRQEVSEEKAFEMYWHGPQWGFASRLEMLRAEFGGRCAYCGQPGVIPEVEHLLPRSAFPFDSYFNLLPACNVRKGARTALQAGLTVHEEAYKAYSEYVHRRKPPHAYHAAKKGLLNLLRRPSAAEQAERRLAMLANDLVTVATTQRSPRPLARYLATKLHEATGRRPEIAFLAGRHTALYRSAMLPAYDKQEKKEEVDLRNHAVDAIVLGCELPSASALENENWGLKAAGIRGWLSEVKRAAPAVLDGMPQVGSVGLLTHFEEDLGAGYCRIDLSAFNWNRKKKATHVLDPFGVTASGLPLKRKPAAAVLAGLKEGAKKRDAQIDTIAHPGLRGLLKKEPGQAPFRFVEWLQETVRASLTTAEVSDHPADQARRQILERFVAAPAEKIVSGEESVPPTVGVRCLVKGSRGKLDVK